MVVNYLVPELIRSHTLTPTVVTLPFQLYGRSRSRTPLNLVIAPIGDENLTQPAFTTYMDQGAKWNDIVDGNGTADANGSVDSNTPGIYQITYSATDTAGNVAVQVVRTIRVVDHDAPTIALLGDANVTHEAGPEYVDAGVRWNIDSVDGNGSADANGTVNYLVPGIYQITYTYTDSSGNPAVPVLYGRSR